MTGIMAALLGSASDPSLITLQFSYSPSNQGFGSPLTASFGLSNTGAILFNNVATGLFWITDATKVGLYEARATLISGALSGGTANVWLSLANNLTWARSGAANQIQEVSFALEIRLTSTGVVEDTSTVTITADGGGFE